MTFADVLVDNPGFRGRRAYTYSVPDWLQVGAGDLVLVPFGRRQAQGIVASSDVPSPSIDTREVLRVIRQAALWPWQIDVARWIADRYLCPAGDAIRMFLPPGLRERPEEAVHATGEVAESPLAPLEQSILDLVTKRGAPLRVASIWRRFGRVESQQALRQLARMGLVDWVAVPRQRRGTARDELVVKMNEEGVSGSYKLPSDLKACADSVCSYLAETILGAQAVGSVEFEGVTLSELTAAVDCSLPEIHRLAEAGLLTLAERVSRAVAPVLSQYPSREQLTPTDAQERALDSIRAAAQHQAGVVLIHGVTGSGKTEVYMRAVDAVLASDRQAIILVPEIGLTPQALGRFASRFPGMVGIIHSGLLSSELDTTWERAKRGGYNVVVGSRSAVFAPLPSIGLIVVDEEHEWTYRQDRTPHYDAREVARAIAERVGATVVLGSATPDVVSYRRASVGTYLLAELPERVPSLRETPESTTGRSLAGEGRAPSVDAIPLPSVSVVDMREELKAGNRSVFSRELVSALTDVLQRKQQTILFLNRRGLSNFLLCRDCGHVPRCRRCDVSLAVHSRTEGGRGSRYLLCHQCRAELAWPSSCPSCASSRIAPFGLGTQALEAEVKRVAPSARVVRWDSDAVKSSAAQENLLAAFARHEQDVLVGTQVVTKGLDLPEVTLVGVVDADTALNLPDFRAAERTFQLLTQVAGRAGRGDQAGHVVIQTYNPNHYAIRAASAHDYKLFYDAEDGFRRAQGYPPYRELARLVLWSAGESDASQRSQSLAAQLRHTVDAEGIPGVEVLGPMPAFYHRLRGKTRWQIIVLGHRIERLLGSLALPLGWTLEMDPVSLL